MWFYFRSGRVLRILQISFLLPTGQTYDTSQSLLLLLLLLLLRLLAGLNIHHSLVHVSSVNHRCFAAHDWLSRQLPHREAVSVKAPAGML